MKSYLLIFTILLLSLSSCFKKEDPISLPVGNSEITSLYLGQSYSKDVFFDLGTNTYQERTWADWDLRFDASKEGYGVFINTGKNMVVRKILSYNLTEPRTVDTFEFRRYPEIVDAPDGKGSSSAMADWRTYVTQQGSTVLNGIYVIEMKYNVGYKRFKRLQVLNQKGTAKDSFYFIILTDLFDNKGDTVKSGEIIPIRKNPNQNYTYFSFTSNDIVQNAEPDKNSWDCVFTRYSHIFYNVLPNNKPFPYILSGVLSNNNNVEVARDSAMTNFEDIDGNTINKYTFSRDKNAIGYDWKAHAQGPGGAYSIVPKITYIIKDTEGNYYKLRFLDYNNELGQSGYPKFEFIRIR